jgi:gas vesicle protein
MNHVTLGIQKFIPYAVVFLLSLVIYSALRPSSPAAYPPYSPERFGEDMSSQEEISRFARELISERQHRFEEVMRRSENQVGAKAADWKLWSDKKASELKQKIEEAKMHQEKMAPRAQEVMSEMLQKSAAKETVDTIRHVSEDIKETAMDAADWWKQHGEQLAEDFQAFKEEKVAATQQFAYDALYAWNHKAEALKDATKEQLEVAKDVAKEKLDDVKDVAHEAKEVASEKLGDMKELAQEKFEELKDTAKDTLHTMQDKLEDAKDLAKDKLEDAKETLGHAKELGEQFVAGASERLQDTWNTVEEKAVEMGQLAQEKLGEAKDLAAEVAESASQKVREVVDDVVGEVGDRMEGVREGISQAAFDFERRLEGAPKPRLMPLHNRLDDNTATGKFASLAQRVKAGLMQDEDVRHAMTMKEDWSRVSLSQKVDDIVQQICLLGDDVAEGVLHKLQLERSQGQC